MSAKTYFQLTGTIFSIIGFVHLLRFLNGWTIVIAGWEAPLWISILGVLLAWFLAYKAFTLAGKKKK